MIQLTNRDKNILIDLARCRVLSLNQLKAAYWPDAKERTCRERLEKLVNAGYLGKTTVPAEKSGIWIDVYHLGIKGKKFVTGPSGGFEPRFVFTNPGKFDEILHQVRTNSVYYKLTNEEKHTWKIGDVIEAEMRGRSNIHVPDAVYVSSTGEEIFVEADVGSYNCRQVRERARGFRCKKVVWVCPEGRKGFLIRYGARGKFITYSISA